jgi:hypothetical protein
MPKTFSQWADEWWFRFDKMEAGTAYEIAKCAKSSETFIDMCKNFVNHHERGWQYQFCSEYKYFKRITDVEKEEFFK